MAWKRVTWADDDGSLTVGTVFDASHMNNIEDGIEALEGLVPGKQPLDSDLTAIAALTTTEFGRSFLTLVGASAARTLLGLGSAAVEPSSAFQPADSDLTAVAALSTTEFGRGLLTQASAAVARATLGLGSAALEPASAFQLADSDLTAIAALTTTSIGRSLLAIADAAAGRTILGAASLVGLEAEAAAREAADAEFRKGLIACRLATDEALPAYTRSTNKIEANANGALPIIDLATVAVGDYVLLKNGAAKADNGIYKVISLGSAVTKWSMERVPELDTSADAVPGLIVSVADGAKNMDRQYSLTTDAPITLNTTALAFTLVASRDWGLLSALPPTKSLLAGDTCSFYGDKPNGVIWDLIYDGEGELPWKKKGGPPLLATSKEERGLENKTSYASLPIDPLKVTVPLKGDYDVRIEARLRSQAAGRFGLLSYAVGATAASDDWGIQLYAGSTDTSEDLSKGSRQLGVAASAVIEEKGKTGGAYLFQWQYRRLWVDPVRVG